MLAQRCRNGNLILAVDELRTAFLSLFYSQSLQTEYIVRAIYRNSNESEQTKRLRKCYDLQITAADRTASNFYTNIFYQYRLETVENQRHNVFKC